MIIILGPETTAVQRAELLEELKGRGYGIHLSEGVERTIVGVIGTPDRDKSDLVEHFEALPFVERVVPILKPYKLVGKAFKPEGTVINVRGVQIGGGNLCIMAGPCTVESPEMLFETAAFVKKAGAHVLRGGAFKPRTSPYSFQGLEEEGLKLLAAAREKTGLPFVTEIISPSDVALIEKYSDMFQIGARNMQNFALLKEVGKAKKPVLLKRGMSSTYKELLMSAEYIMSQGNYDVVLCERGIRTFEDYTRNTFDLAAVPALKEMSHLPVIVDPSHGTGIRSLVTPMAKAAVPVGADGLIVEMHPNPEKAFSDGAQSLTPEQFAKLMDELRRYLPLENRHL